MDMFAKNKKTIVSFLLVLALIILFFACINLAPSPFDTLRVAEKNDLGFINDNHNLYLKYSEKDGCFLMIDYDENEVFYVYFSRGFGKYMVVTITDINEKNSIHGSAEISKNGKTFKMEVKFKQYSTLYFYNCQSANYKNEAKKFINLNT